MKRTAIIRASLILLTAIVLKQTGLAQAQDAPPALAPASAPASDDVPVDTSPKPGPPVEHVGQASGPFSEIGDGFKQLGHEVGQGAREVGHKAKEVGTGIGHAARDSAKAVGNGATEAAHGVGNATRNAVNGVDPKPEPTKPAPEPATPAAPPPKN